MQRLVDLAIATEDELHAVENMARWSARAHLRFRLDSLERLVRAGRIVLAMRNGRPIGFAYATVDYPNASIRGLAVMPGESTRPIVETVLGYYCTAARREKTTNMTFIGKDSWLLPYLVDYGFERCGEIIGLQRRGTSFALPGNERCHVRAATAQDVDAIVEVDWSAFALLWRHGPVTVREFMDQMPYFLVATEDDRVVGYGCGTLYGKLGHIVRLAVHQEFQRRGIGTRLMREMSQRMVRDGARGFSLNTQSDNRRSQAFYRSLGFVTRRMRTPVYRYFFQP